ncbi:MAG: 4Fe-4S dicluster domain-containing protein [Gordonibacter pamelaeae]
MCSTTARGKRIDGDDAGNCFNWNKIPVPTDLCDLCADRVAAGRKPTCVHHCQAFCMEFGPLDELAQELAAKPKQVFWAPAE